MRHFFLFLCVAGFLSFSATAENFYIDHVAAENWTTSITVYNTGLNGLAFDLERWDTDGTPLTTLTGISVAAGSSTTLTNADFGYNGMARVITPPLSTLIVKLSYRYQESHSLCEFFIPQNYNVQHWMLPNPYQSHFDWFGMALSNFNATTATVTLTAYQAGAVVATEVVTIPAHTKIVDVSSGFWDSVQYSDVDLVMIESDLDIPAPLSITGNTEQDRHVFFLAQYELQMCMGTKTCVIPHVAEENWTTELTVYNNKDSTGTFTYSSWNADGLPDVVDQLVAVQPHGTATLLAGTDFTYGGSAVLTTTACLHFKLAYRYGESESLCDFFLHTGEGTTRWIMPNSIQEWFDWFGVAVCNPTEDDVVMAMDAYKDGQCLDTYAQILAPHTKTVGITSTFWTDLQSKKKAGATYNDIDMVVLRSSYPIANPLSITGNAEQNRHVFFLAGVDTSDNDIPDENFKAYLLANFDTDHDGTLSQVERYTVTYIDTPGGYSSPGNIRNIEGVQMFPNLQHLDCSCEDLYWLPDLSSLTHLEYLNADNNHLIQIRGDFLPDSPTFLRISSNRISSVSLPANMNSLKYLYMEKNQLLSIPSLTAYTHLTNLDFHTNQLTEFPDITGLTTLQAILCLDNQLTSLPDLSSFTNLTILDCSMNSELSSIPGLSALTNLQRLYFYKTSITDLSAVSGLTQLTNLQCGTNGITTLPDLSALSQLNELTISNNPISQIPGLASLTALTQLVCSGTLVTDLSGIANLTGLKYLYCHNSPVATIPNLSALDALLNMNCSHCALEDVPDVTGCASINSLYCYYNNFGTDDCATINAIEAMGLSTFVYNPQNGGSTLTCP